MLATVGECEDEVKITYSAWDPKSAESWSALFGFVRVPLFGPGPTGNHSDRDLHSVLLDGAQGSFAFSLSDDPSLHEGTDSLYWTWSANLRHHLVVQPSRERMYLRRWDTPHELRPLRLTKSPNEAVELLTHMATSAPSKSANVIGHALRGLRIIRGALGDLSAEISIQCLNAVLLHVYKDRKDPDDRYDWDAERFRQAVGSYDHDKYALNDFFEAMPWINNNELERIVAHFVRPEPMSRLSLIPELLLRHASSHLYQQAHLELARTAQIQLPGLSSEAVLIEGTAPRDVRFTPANLARALVQECFKAWEPDLSTKPEMTVLDPACGSGVFLVECAREFKAHAYSQNLKLIGFDISSVSTSMTRFALGFALDDYLCHPPHVRIETQDSLATDWELADIILMNPPFKSWEQMDREEQALVAASLGVPAVGRPDMAMAFVHKALEALRPGGVLATVLPAPLLQSKSGQTWRDNIADNSDIVTIGRFEGYSYFMNSFVEPAFVVAVKRPERGTRRDKIRIVIAPSGHEDIALRALRAPEYRDESTFGPVSDFEVSRRSLTTSNWFPRKLADFTLLDHIASLGFSTIKTLFSIRQGVRTGLKRAFVLSTSEYTYLSKSERIYFRPAAGQGSIEKGVLSKLYYVFYPYASSGVLLTSEAELKRKLPRFFEKWLSPLQEQLEGRKKIQEWWLPTWPRNWQFGQRPKIVSTYFGASGSFAYDDTGEFVVVDGFAWIPREEREYDSKVLETDLAYLALVNSSLFERVVSCFSWRLQGGQLRLEARFLDDIPIPDLTALRESQPVLIGELANLGHQITQGHLNSIIEELDVGARKAYSNPPS